MRRDGFTTGIIAAIVTILTLSGAAAADFNVVSLGDSSVPYVSLIDLAEAYNIVLSYDPATLDITATRGPRSVTVTNRSATIIHDGAPVNMVYPAQLIQGAMFVPARTFLPVFSDLLPGELRWDDRRKQIDTTGIRQGIESIRFKEYEDGMLMCFELAEPMNCSEEMTGGGWLTLQFNGGSYDPERLFADIRGQDRGLIREIRHRQQNGAAILSLKLADTVDTYSVTTGNNPAELQLSLRYRREETAGNTLLPGDGSLSSGGGAPLLSPGPDLNTDLILIDTVVIDAGHGGKDPGAIGPGGTYEKDIVLAVAKELKQIIDDRREIKAVMTRDRDVYPTLEDRAHIASEANGKLFISIHANAVENSRVSGMEVYFLSEAKTENAKRVAERENAVVRFEDNPGRYSGDIGTLSRIQFDMLSNVYIDESQYLCQLLLDKGVGATKQINRGVKQGPFYVLLGTQALMPSVLFEIGYISNANEETMMKRVSYQKRMAEAIYDAIIEFKRRAERDLATEDR